MEKEWNEYARHYDTLRLLPPYHAFQNDIMKNLVSLVRKMNNYNQINILDIGCGTGNFIEMILNDTKDFNSKNIKVVGVDNSKEMLKIARIKSNNDWRVNFIEGDIDKIIETFRPLSYQAIIMSNVLYTLENSSKIFTQISNILCDRGILIISDPKPDFRYSRIFLDSLRSWRFLFLMPRIVGSLWWIYLHNRRAIDGAQYHFYTVDEVRRLLDETRFNIVKTEEAYAKQNFLITAVKK